MPGMMYLPFNVNPDGIRRDSGAIIRKVEKQLGDLAALGQDADVRIDLAADHVHQGAAR
jgi:hypothetical protein